MDMVFLIEVPHTGRVNWRYGESLIAIAWDKCEHDYRADKLWVDDYEETEDGAKEYLTWDLNKGIVIRTEADLIREYRWVTNPDLWDRHQRFGIIAALEEIADFVNRYGFADTEIKLPGRATEEDEEEEE